jgi:hypothetical protein
VTLAAAVASVEPPKGSARVVNLSTLELAYTIHVLEYEMTYIGIGASVMLFGVLVSTMYLQVEIVGTMMVLVLTVVFHPAFWTGVMA